MSDALLHAAILIEGVALIAVCAALFKLARS